MTAATELWAAVVASYPTESLTQLTNIHDRAATTITTAVGESAAQSVIDLWPAYVQADYDSTAALNVEAGKKATIAVLQERGGSSSQLAKIKWGEVFSKGMLEVLKRTGPRGRQGPLASVDPLAADGSKRLTWSDRNSMPPGVLPERRGRLDVS